MRFERSVSTAATTKHGSPSRGWHRITGRIGQSSYKVEGETRYSIDLFADGFAILAKAKVKTVDDDMQD